MISGSRRRLSLESGAVASSTSDSGLFAIETGSSPDSTSDSGLFVIETGSSPTSTSNSGPFGIETGSSPASTSDSGPFIFEARAFAGVDLRRRSASLELPCSKPTRRPGRPGVARRWATGGPYTGHSGQGHLHRFEVRRRNDFENGRSKTAA